MAGDPNSGAPFGTRPPPSRGSENGPPLTPGAVMTAIPKFVIDQAMGMLGAVKSRIAPKILTPLSATAPAPAAAAPQVTLSDPNGPQSPQAQQQMQRLSDIERRPRREPWFGPSTPQQGNAPRGDVAGRARDYPVAINQSLTPRQYEAVSFGMLRGLFDGLDLAKICVRTRLNQMSKLSWEIMPKMAPGENVRRTDDPRCKQLEEFFKSPDRLHPWDVWMRMLLEEMMVIDAPAIYVRRTIGGDIYSFEVIDGADIIPRLDALGRTPQPPDIAYTHILKGIPAVNYTTDELVYFPRNLKAGKVYGKSDIENILLTIQIAIRRDVNKLQYWTEGNIPDALIGVPATWTPEQIANMQALFDSWTADQAARRKAYFIPGGTSFNATRPPQTLDPQQDEWLARVVTYAFNLPNLPLVNQQNRATSETANDAGLREGLAPTIVWLKGLMDLLIQKFFGFPDLEWVMDNYREEDPDALAEREMEEVKTGLLSGDEYRAKRGQSAIGMKHAIWGVGPMGIMFVEDLLKAQAMGLMMPQAAPAPDAGLGPAAPYDNPSAGAPALPPGAPLAPQGPALPAPGQQKMLPAPPASLAPVAHHSMAQLPPKLLEAVGLKPDYKKVAHPVGKSSKAAPPIVMSTLLEHEAKMKGKAGKSNHATRH